MSGYGDACLTMRGVNGFADEAEAVETIGQVKQRPHHPAQPTLRGGGKDMALLQRGSDDNFK
jgi:hypothetical protein